MQLQSYKLLPKKQVGASVGSCDPRTEGCTAHIVNMHYSPIGPAHSLPRRQKVKYDILPFNTTDCIAL